MKKIGIAVVALFTLAAASPSLASIDAPLIRKAVYFENVRRGPHYQVFARIRRDPVRVTAKSGDVRANGHNRRNFGDRSHVWLFRDHKFKQAVRADLYADGFATLLIKAVDAEGDATKKACELKLFRNPEFGDTASDDDCEKVEPS